MCQEYHYKYQLCNHVDGNPHGEVNYCKRNCGVPDWELVEVPSLCRICTKHYSRRARRRRFQRIFCCGN